MSLSILSKDARKHKVGHGGGGEVVFSGVNGGERKGEKCAMGRQTEPEELHSSESRAYMEGVSPLHKGLRLVQN